MRLPRHPHRNGPGRRRTATVVTAGLLGLGVASAMIVPGASAAPRPTVTSVQRAVDRLQEQAEQASERYNDARVNLKSANVRLKAAREKLVRQRAEVKQAKVQMGRIAAETYRRGQLGTLDVVLGDDPESVLAQSGYLPSVGERQSGAVDRLRDGERKLTLAEQTVRTQQRQAEHAELRMKINKNTVQERLAQAQAQLATLQAAQRRQLVRQQRVVAARNVPAGGSASMCRAMAGQAGSADARKALDFACDQLGDPYVWAADGPGTWDCSGLTMRAWKEGGVSLPHSSAMQAGYGRRVGTGDLQPGDLVFFHAPISHVGIYLGAGLMVHAPKAGDVVRVAALWTTPSAAVRL